jgi:hypothetical protein
MNVVLMRERSTGNTVKAMRYDGTADMAFAIAQWAKPSRGLDCFYVMAPHMDAPLEAGRLFDAFTSQPVPPGVYVLHLPVLDEYRVYTPAFMGAHFEVWGREGAPCPRGTRPTPDPVKPV